MIPGNQNILPVRTPASIMQHLHSTMATMIRLHTLAASHALDHDLVVGAQASAFVARAFGQPPRPPLPLFFLLSVFYHAAFSGRQIKRARS